MFAIASLICNSAFVANAASNIIEKPAFDTLVVTYRHTSTIQMQGAPSVDLLREEIRYIDVSRNKMRIEKFLVTEKEKKLIGIKISNSKGSYQIDPEQKQATFSDLSAGNKAVWTEGILMKGEMASQFSNAGVKITSEKFLGKSCTVLEMMMHKQWIWNGILLKHVMDGGPMITVLEATSIQENPKLSPKLFKLPPGVQVKTLEESFSESMQEIREWNRKAAIGRPLGKIRSAVIRYYSDAVGKYPPSLDALVPKYIDRIPDGNWEYDPATGKVTSSEYPDI